MDLPGSDTLSDPRRKVPRWYLHDGSTPLESQSCGIAARLMVSGLLFDKSIGRAVIKDGQARWSCVASKWMGTTRHTMAACMPRLGVHARVLPDWPRWHRSRDCGRCGWGLMEGR